MWCDQLVVIHNDNGQAVRFKKICDDAGVVYVRRDNRGFDIGAMQDVFAERLEGFPNDWRFLLWCTDDVIPMEIDFALPFLSKMNRGAGLAAMHISREYKPHVRTGCFCISKTVSRKIVFPADPVSTKKHCYEFEHRGLTLTDQVRLMGFDCVQVSPLRSSPMYDTEYWKRNQKAMRLYNVFNRENEHKRIFNEL